MSFSLLAIAIPSQALVSLWTHWTLPTTDNPLRKYERDRGSKALILTLAKIAPCFCLGIVVWPQRFINAATLLLSRWECDSFFFQFLSTSSIKYWQDNWQPNGQSSFLSLFHQSLSTQFFLRAVFVAPKITKIVTFKSSFQVWNCDFIDFGRTLHATSIPYTWIWNIR